ncbi:hypothetical protein [Neisseria zoodegmatis]|uniref:hypothetical protein n=1 Tax=Neisseria zoodegmatis TaxID=326523 RepID=UPI00117CD7EA|nr:hypothetical protein [Neisseria zoodegmatis]
MYYILAGGCGLCGWICEGCGRLDVGLGYRVTRFDGLWWFSDGMLGCLMCVLFVVVGWDGGQGCPPYGLMIYDGFQTACRDA